MEAGKPAIWRDEIPGACYQKTLLNGSERLMRGRCFSEYLRLVFLRDLLVCGEIRLTLHPGVGIVHLTARTECWLWPIPLPPFPESSGIVDEADRLEVYLPTNAKSNAGTQLVRLQRLRQSVLSGPSKVSSSTETRPMYRPRSCSSAS